MHWPSADTTSELTNLEDELNTVFAENVGLQCRIRQSQAINGQMKARLGDLQARLGDLQARLGDLQALLNTVQDFVQDILAECE